MRGGPSVKPLVLVGVEDVRNEKDVYTSFQHLRFEIGLGDRSHLKYDMTKQLGVEQRYRNLVVAVSA